MDAVTMLVVWVVGLLVLYFVVRAAVKGGILDADRVRARERGADTSAEAPNP
jgi:flagellar biosynthesis/type III secretory pathway M-ring protein FliF/YscJ